LFPESNVLLEKSKLFEPVVGMKTPFERLTITPSVIQSGKLTFLLALGEEKGRILAQALKQPEDISSFRDRLVIDSAWILDSNATKQKIVI